MMIRYVTKERRENDSFPPCFDMKERELVCRGKGKTALQDWLRHDTSLAWTRILE